MTAELGLDCVSSVNIDAMSAQANVIGDIRPEPSLSAFSRYIKWFIHAVRPSITTSTKESARHGKLGRTAYLDGLRGLAAFMVYWHHHHLWARGMATGIFENGFGYMGEHYFVTLPFIRNLFTGGHFAVAVFFVISGYVLSVKPLTLIQSGDYVKLGENLASALFRRWIRLYIPVIATTILYIFWFHGLGITVQARQKETLGEELWAWYTEFKQFSFIFRTGALIPWLTYNVHTWTIPIEFKGSILIYTCLQAFSRATRNTRLLCSVGMIVYFMYIADGAHYAMFMTGMLLADLDALAAQDNLPRFFFAFKRWTKCIFYSFFVAALYFGGVPSFSGGGTDNLAKSPGWYYMSFMKPQAVGDYKWFFLYWAATFLIASIRHIHWLKAFFETRFPQYLGRISFALYLVHGPVISIIGDRLYAAVGRYREENKIETPGWVNAFPLPQIGPLGLETDFWACHIILLPTTLWLAEVVTRVVDEPAVKFARWVYSRTL